MEARFVQGRTECERIACGVAVNHSHDPDDKTTVDGIYIAITTLGVNLAPINYCQLALTFDESRNLAYRILRAIGDKVPQP